MDKKNNCFFLIYYLDSTAVSIFVVILVELTNTQYLSIQPIKTNTQYLSIQPIKLQILRWQCCLSPPTVAPLKQHFLTGS